MPITRRDFVVRSSFAALAGSLAPASLFAQQPTPPVVPEFKTLRRNVGTFTGRGGTIGWLMASDAVLVVDSQFADAAQVFLTEIKPKTSRKIDVLVNSHHHPDHTGGNKTMKPAVGKIVAHENSAAAQRRQAAAQKSEDAQAYPDETFKDTWKADLGSEVVSAKYYGAGHTGGDVAIFFERANVVHMGDLMSHYRHPRADRPAGASVQHWITVLEQTVKDHDAQTIYIFGHSKPGTPVSGSRADLMLMRDYFTGVIQYVEAAIKAGTPAEQVVKTATLPKFPQHEGDFNFLLQATYDELTKKTI